MRILLFLLCFSWLNNCFAQDDMPDFRSKRENFSKMQEKDLQADLATFTMAGIDQSLAKLTLETLPVVKYGSNFIEFAGDNISVKITAGVFFPTQHKIFYSDKYLTKIDNKPYYGNYGKMPTISIASVAVTINGDSIQIPQTAFADLFNPSFIYTDQQGKIKTHDNVYLSADKRKIYIYMLNLDNTGGYEVTWIIEDKKFVRRVVDFDLGK